MSSSKGPGLFSSFGQKVRDTLNRDYSIEHNVSVSSQTANGVAISSSVVQKSGISGGDVTVGYKYKNTTVNAIVDLDSNLAAILIFNDILPSTRTIASLRYPEHNASKVEAQYFHEHASVTACLDLNKTPTVNASITIGTPFIAFGTEASYKVDSGSFAKYNAGVNLTMPNYGVAVILADKGDTVKASSFYHPDQLKRGVMVGEISRKLSTNENTLTMGGSYAVDSQTLVKAKLNNHGHLCTVVQHEFTPKSFLTLSGSFDSLAMEKRPRLGLKLSLRP